MMTQPTVEQKTALKMAACIAAHNGSFLEEQRVAEDLQNARPVCSSKALYTTTHVSHHSKGTWPAKPHLICLRGKLKLMVTAEKRVTPVPSTFRFSLESQSQWLPTLIYTWRDCLVPIINREQQAANPLEELLVNDWQVNSMKRRWH